MAKLKYKGRNSKKECTQCRELKPITEFSEINQRGKRVLSARCKYCVREYKRQWANSPRGKNTKKSWYEQNRDKMKSYNKDYYSSHKEVILLKQKQYLNTTKGIEVTKKCRSNYRSTDIGKLKDRARSAVNHAIRDGKLSRPKYCSSCNCECVPEAHHKDYNDFLDVVWLCKRCHESEHHLNEGNVSSV